MKSAWLVTVALGWLLTAAPPLGAQDPASAPRGEPAAARDDTSTLESVLPRLFPVRIELEPDSSGEEGRDLSQAVEIVLLLTFLTLLPPLLLTMTCFTRIIVVLSFVRRAMATPELPPTPILIGLSLFLSAAVMQPLFGRVYDRAVEPYLDKELAFADAGAIAGEEWKQFLLVHTRESDLALFLEMTEAPPPDGPEDVSLRVAIPAFILSELKTAFQMGFVLYLPFLVIDLVVSSILISMGMFMLPPMLIATPLKILLFVLVDGWGLVIRQLWTSLAPSVGGA